MDFNKFLTVLGGLFLIVLFAFPQVLRFFFIGVVGISILGYLFLEK